MDQLTESTLSLGQEVYESMLYEPFEDVQHCKDMIKQQMAMKAACFDVTLSEPIFEDVTPDDQRVAIYVDEKEWPAGTRCVIGTATVTQMHGVFARPENAGAEWLADLDADGLAWLRKLTRDVAAVYGRSLTDVECDSMIAERGPEVAENIIKKIQAGL